MSVLLPARVGEEAKAMRYVRLIADDKGETHFRDEELEMTEADYRPPAPLLFVSHAHESSAIQFVRLPAGWVGESFTVPSKQFLICVAGKLGVTVSDGESRTFRTGDVVQMEDTHGKGHTTRVDASQDCIAAVAPILD
jgi:hypothetical protein